MSGLKNINVEYFSNGSGKVSSSLDSILAAMASIEKKTFPKHESLASAFKEETTRRNTVVMFVRQEGTEAGKAVVDERLNEQVAGYIFFVVSSLLGSITKLAVREASRRRGYGKALLESAITHMRKRGVQTVALHVDPERTAAVKLYESFNFRQESFHESYYAPERHAYRMVLEFR